MKALAYPAFLVIVGLAVVGFLLVYVMPTFVGVYGESWQQLPAATQLLIDLIHYAQAQLVWVAGAVAIAAASFPHGTRRRPGDWRPTGSCSGCPCWGSC